jgi:energy-converting hydrogenase Eha subunit A
MPSGKPTSILNQIIIELGKSNPRALMGISWTVSALYGVPIICTGVLALAVLVIGVVVLVQAKGNGKTEQPGGDIPTS